MYIYDFCTWTDTPNARSTTMSGSFRRTEVFSCKELVSYSLTHTFFLTLALIACASRDLVKYDLTLKVCPSCHTLRKQHFLTPSICSSHGEEPYHHHQQHEETHGHVAQGHDGVHFPFLSLGRKSSIW